MSFQLTEADRLDTLCAFEVSEHTEDDAASLLERFLIVTGGRLINAVCSHAQATLRRAVAAEPRAGSIDAANALRGY